MNRRSFFRMAGKALALAVWGGVPPELVGGVVRYALSPLPVARSQAELQAALDAMPPEGGTVYVQEGTYVLRGPITIPSRITGNINIIGLGRGVVWLPDPGWGRL